MYHEVKTLALIFTDKAANSSNVMGAAERLEELYVQALVLDAAHSPAALRIISAADRARRAGHHPLSGDHFILHGHS